MGVKFFIRRLTPRWLLGLYHWLMSWLAALVFGLPGRKLIVIGVTGTKGKTSTASMLWHILQSTGESAGLISTAQMAVSKKTWLNDLKMTMPGRANLQKLLRQMVREGCKYAVIETSSEGLTQWRHVGLPYQLAVFTNLAPEHLTAHGSFAAYRSAKARLFKTTARYGGMGIINLDDEAADYFIKQSANHAWGYTFKNQQQPEVSQNVSAQLGQVSATKVGFYLGDVSINLSIGGEFNAYNALAAMTAALKLGIPLAKSAAALTAFAGTPGRLEFVQHEPFAVVVDYAHTTESLAAVYKTLKGPGKLIAVLGSCGGGRDKPKRGSLGKLAGEYASYVIVTNEDPYDELPDAIMAAVAAGGRQAGKREGENLFVIPDRRLAIRKALTLAQAGDTVVITGKGAEQWLCLAGGKKIPWDDRQVVREELTRLSTPRAVNQ